MSHLTMNTHGDPSGYKSRPPQKQRQIISALAMSQNELEQDDNVDEIIKQEMIHQSMLTN